MKVDTDVLSIHRGLLRQANAALWGIVIVRLRSRHTPTMDYLERRVTAGNSKRDAIR